MEGETQRLCKIDEKGVSPPHFNPVHEDNPCTLSLLNHSAEFSETPKVCVPVCTVSIWYMAVVALPMHSLFGLVRFGLVRFGLAKVLCCGIEQQARKFVLRPAIMK